MITNTAAYHFVPIADADALAARLLGRAQALELRGTILVAAEGINLFLAGPEAAVRGFVAWLREEPRFAAIEPKESWSDAVPFGKLLVKVKREIIRMNHPSIRPEAGRAPSVAPAVLARWLAQGQDDEGRPVVTLDTRNAFEIDHGTFAGAIDWRITKFSEFPQAVLDHRDDLTGKTIVSFCTGGIRCEKAAIYLQDIGLDHVYQLEGGILKYFEETDGAPGWQGGCFVFDEREALGAQLTPLRADAATPPAR